VRTDVTSDASGRMLRALLRDEPWDELVLETGADADGPFCAAVSRGAAASFRAPTAAWSATVVAGSSTWVLAQISDADQLARVAPPPAGVGSVRTGWEGARQSLVDARLALAVCRGRTATFEEDWVLATLFASRDRLVDVCEPGRVVASRSRHLADAVQAFADHRLSVVGAARALQVHPNTVIYRLERWRGLTGWDPRTFRGLAASVACLGVAP
jgi:sugar diacid utilization regulator